MKNYFNEDYKTHTDPNITMMTYPRSGRHWMYWYIKTNTSLKIRFIHNTKDSFDQDYYKKIISAPIITIIRSPKESIASINAMEQNMRVNFRINDYIDHYEFLLQNASLFFDYEDIMQKTPNIADFLCNKFGGKILGVNNNIEDYKKWYKETQSPFIPLTSKNLKLYNNSLEHLRSVDLSKHKELYDIAKSKCIKF